MLKHILIPLTLSFICFCTSEVSKKRLEGFMRSPIGNAIMDADKNVIKTKTKTGLACVSECLRRRECKFFRFIEVRLWKAWKCSMYIGEQQGPLDYPQKDLCKKPREKSDYIIRYPSAVAGVCSDHRCAKKTVCTPTTPGQYTCELDKGTKRQMAKERRRRAREKRREAREKRKRLAAKRKSRSH